MGLGGECGVLTRMGFFWWQVYPEGTHFMIPWFDRPVIYDVRARPNIVESTSGSRDLQMVSDSVVCANVARLLIFFENVYAEGKYFHVSVWGRVCVLLFLISAGWV